MDIFLRSEALFGKEKMELLKKSRVAVFGLGGVGGYVVEALARSGVGALDIIDADRVDITNINRQIIALQSTVGEYKCKVMGERIKDINPECAVKSYPVFFCEENKSVFNFGDFDYVVDAVDTVSAKLLLAECTHKKNTHLISAMGAANKLDPTLFKVADIYETSVCPLARVMRRELKKRNIPSLKVVYSQEGVCASHNEPILASCAFAPAAMGIIIAAEVVKDLMKSEGEGTR